MLFRAVAGFGRRGIRPGDEPMETRPIRVDDALQELTQHGTTDFPFSMDEQVVSDPGCLNIRHWHVEVQILRMIKGDALFETPSGRFLLREGEGIFLNSGVLHEVVSTSDPESRYLCANFKPGLIAGSEGNAITRDYILPITENAELAVIPLRSEPWHRAILDTLLEMGTVWNNRAYGYELALKECLCRIWRILAENNRTETERTAPTTFSDQQRVRMLKQFIHTNYMHRVTLDAIAGAAHISRGECCRVFQRTDQISPFSYLRTYRIHQAGKLLLYTNLPISEIAFQTGFESSSYFIACFKKEMHCTPLEYRRSRYEKPSGAAGQMEVPR